MAKVDKITATYRGKYQTWEVHFNTKQGFFIKDCPGSVIDYGEFENRADTLGDIKTRFIIARQKAEKELLTSRRVILVKLTITRDGLRKPKEWGRNDIDRDNPLNKFIERSSFNDMDGVGFAIDYREAIEVDRGEDLAYYRPGTTDLTDQRNGRIHISKNETPILYSDQAIENLARIKAQLLAMIEQVGGFFSHKEHLQQALESNTFLKLNP